MIKVSREPKSDDFRFVGNERCCFCRMPTPFWHKPSDVAVCEACAQIFCVKDIPHKRAWCELEHLIGEAIKRYSNPMVTCFYCRDPMSIPDVKCHAPVCTRCKRVFSETNWPSWQTWAQREEKIRKGIHLLHLAEQAATERVRKRKKKSPGRRPSRSA